ncbi:MAG: tetratricopeptide repeat protein [bacterium]|nr:tetratricopeptide repeat protein [bacterium]
MKPKATIGGMKLIEKTPFSTLVKSNRALAALRRDYAARPAPERRIAADWEYHSQMASESIGIAMARSGKDCLGTSEWPQGFVALAIDPQYAPALLTVGSIEYQVGHVKEAMTLFTQLVQLPKDEKDLSSIIDKAGDFLIDQDDYENALALYSAAERVWPDEVVYLLGVGYCLGKLGHHEESVEKHRRVVALEPDNYKHLSDLGFTLLEAGQFDEAEAVLQKSISLAPATYQMARGNLIELKKRRKRKTAAS